MNINFQIHDRAMYPDGAEVDVDFEALGAKQLQVLAQTLDGNRCRKPALVGSVAVGNLWLTEPTWGAFTTALDALAGLVSEYEVRAELAAAKRVGRAAPTTTQIAATLAERALTQERIDAREVARAAQAAAREEQRRAQQDAENERLGEALAKALKYKTEAAAERGAE